MKHRKKGLLTIKREIFLLSFLFLAIVALIFSGFFIDITYQESMESAKNSLRECNSQIVTYTEGVLHESAAMLGLLSLDAKVVEGGAKNADEVLFIYQAFLKDNKNITYIYSGYENGNLLISDYDIPLTYDATASPWYQAATARDGVARLVYTDVVTGERLLNQSRKLVDSDGNMTGVVAIDTSNDNITKQLSAKYQYDSQRSFIIDPEGVVLIHPEEKYINDRLSHYMKEDLWASIADGISNYGEYEKDGVKAMAYVERIPETNFLVVTAIDASEVTEPIIHSVIFFLVLMICISIALGFALSRILLYRFARPIIALKSRIEKVAGGCQEEEAELSFTNEEINDIADGIEKIVKDIARQEEQRKAAEYLSYHDTMTGLYNRRFLEKERDHLEKEENHPLCTICCDINGLKLVNDVFGHQIGDQLICRVAECLAKECRKGDVLSRVGGDEFILMMPCTAGEDAIEVILRIKEEFDRKDICGAKVSASLGYGIRESREEAFDKAALRADQMMYGQKLVESGEMKRQTADNIISVAAGELLVNKITESEESVLKRLADTFCPESACLLKESYRLRKVGLCTLFQAGGDGAEINKCHTENGYRLLSAVEAYRGIAGYVLHYTEHWDGSGWPAGLAGRDLPMISRIIAVADAYFSAGEHVNALRLSSSWYDPEIVSVLIDGEKGFAKTGKSIDFES